MCRGYQITGVSRRRFFRISGRQIRVWTLALFWPQDVEYFSSYHPILRDTSKGNTQETAGGGMVICLTAFRFHPMSAMKIR